MSTSGAKRTESERRDKTGTKNQKASETGKQKGGSGGSKSGGDKKKEAAEKS